jgi:signal transduction histidine kinase
MIQEFFSSFIKDPGCFATAAAHLPDHSISLIIYSHIPAALITLLLGIFLLVQSRHKKIRVFFALAMSFVFFIVAHLILQLPFLGKEVVMVAESFVHVLDPLIMLLSFYFLYFLLKRKDAPFSLKILGLIPLVPVVVLVVLGENLWAYDPAICRSAENPFLSHYIFFVDLCYFVVAAVYSFVHAMRHPDTWNETVPSIGGVCLFMGIFFVTQNIFTERLVGNIFIYDYQIYAFFAMPLVVAFLAYLAVRFKVFRVRLFTSQIFVMSVFFLILSQFFFLNNAISIILNTLLIFFMILITHIVFGDVKEEIEVREQVEELALNLSAANQNLKKTNIKLEELNLQKNEFISIATHQLRGPLSSIKGYASLILQGDLGQSNEKTVEAIEIIMQSAQSLAVIVDDYLDVSRIEQGTMKYDFSICDLREIVEMIVTEFTPIIKIAHLGISFECDKSEQYLTHADKGKIKQVFTNLLDNSIKYTPAGTIVLKLEKKADKTIVFSVNDTGVGIDPQVLPHLFARFSRAPEASKINMLGTGLGLFVAKKIVEVHQGRVWAESEGQGRGSHFFVELKGE